MIENLEQTEYTDIESVCAFLGIDVPSGSSDEAEEIHKKIRIASRIMDRTTGRKLYTDEETTVTFDGTREGILNIGDFAEISEVKIDGVALAESEYHTYPRNKPYISRLALEGRYWPITRGSIEITGYNALYKEMPEDLQYAATVIAAGLYQTEHPSEDAEDVTSESIGNYKVTYTSTKQAADASSAMALLKSYKRIAL